MIKVLFTVYRDCHMKFVFTIVHKSVSTAHADYFHILQTFGDEHFVNMFYLKRLEV